ncbi:MAG TPA: tetratricopeptide repeat protein [Candidatus Sulfopaludibacter sp.]|jgi:tetratricopeptide (TPR) repeat protein|nr:tetratricopeptide repeat protein [Candidatus Sulfopaludibacter sp.]
MIRSAKALLLVVSVGSLCLAQSAKPQAATTPAPDNKSGAYYHFAMGRLYAELGQAEGNKDDITKAIQHYQEALKLDPSAHMIFDELTDLYMQTGRLRDAVTQAEDLLKQNPENLDARRMLGRIYWGLVGNPRDGRIDENYVKQAMEQYTKITQKDPNDAESWVMLGRLNSISHNSQEAEKSFNAALKADPENEDALTGLASVYLDLGDTKAAIAKLKAVTEKSPNERTLAALAKAYEDLQDYKDAADALKRAVQMGLEDERITDELADDLLQSGQADEALKLYQQLANDEPRNPKYQLKLTELYMNQHDLAKARASLEKAKQADPANLSVRYNDASLLEQEGHVDKAITVLQGVLTDTERKQYTDGERKNRAIFLEKLAEAYRMNDQTPQAVETLQKLSVTDPDAAPQASVQIIRTYREAKDYTAALREADAAVKKFPKEPMVVVEHAQTLADSGKVDPAATELRTLLNGKQDRAIYLEMAQAYEKGKRWDDMAKVLDQAEKLSSTDDDKSTVYFMRGAMLERQKKFEPAEAEFRKVLAIDPNSDSALNYLGYMLADRNIRLDEASTMIKKALDIKPDNGAYLDSLGWVYYRQGKFSDAEGVLVRALQKQQDPTVHDHLGDVYAKLGKTKEAVAQWQASLKEFQKAAPSENDPEEVAKVTKKLDDAQAKLARESRR